MFKKIDILSLPLNTIKLIGQDWMLITAGNINKNNTMTASWGSLGVLWGKPTATIYIRPQRYTKEFIDKEDFLTISFYDEKYKNILQLCGTVSGRNENKIEKAGLTPKIFDESVAFEEAKLVLVLKKLYVSQFEKSRFLDNKNIDMFYKNDDFHHIYISEILNAYINT